MGKTKHKKTTDIIDNSKPLEYENLVIEGGGVLGIAYLGALKELYEDQTINKIKCFAGSSIGAIVALILSIRCQYDRLSELILNLNLSEFKDRSWIIPDIARFFNNFGFYKGDKLLSFIQDILKQNADNANITFKEIYDKYETKLVITGTNLSKGNVSYFSYEHTPDMSVALACRISASVPYFFQSVLYNKDYYVDGGILNNYPINVFDHESQQPNMKTLGLKLISEADINMEKGNMAPITNLKNFSQNLINSVQSQSLKIYVKSDDWKRTVPIYTGNLSFLNFNLTNEEKLFLVNEGSKAIKLYKSKMSTLSN
jgi:NTE family protein